MPPWLISILIGCTTIIFSFVLTRLTTKDAAELKATITDLKKNTWTLEQRIELEKKLIRYETLLGDLKSEVDFTKSSHAEFLRLLEKALIPVAHSPHTPDLDELLDKRNRGEELSVQEWEDLIKKLGEQAALCNNLPGKQVSLLGLRAIYLTQLRLAKKKAIVNSQEAKR